MKRMLWTHITYRKGHFDNCVSKIQKSNIFSKLLALWFHIAEREHERIKKLFITYKELLLKKAFQSATGRCSINRLLLRLLLRLQLYLNQCLGEFFKDLTINSRKPSVVPSIENFKIHETMLNGLLQKKLFKKLFFIISILHFHPAKLLNCWTIVLLNCLYLFITFRRARPSGRFQNLRMLYVVTRICT